MSKALVVLDYVREAHLQQGPNGWENCYHVTKYGKKLKEKLARASLTRNDYSLDYVYPMIPKPEKVDPRSGRVLTYKNPTQKEWKPYSEQLADRIVETKPRIVIPTGSLGSKMMVGLASITTTRGRPVKVDFTHSVTKEVYSVWVLPMFSMEYIISQPNVEGKLDADLVTLGKFWEEGETVFIPKETSYEFVETVSRVDEIFDMFKTPQVGKSDPRWLVSWDLETNTTSPELPGAKPLVMSLSWEHGQGVTIPLQHKDWTKWSTEDLNHIYGRIAEFVADGNIIKVGHNIQFDIRFLMSTRGIKDFKNHRDTKILYWLTVTQQVEDSFRLSDLSFELTDMGGYDDPLEEFKVADKRRRQELVKAEIKERKDQAKAEAEARYQEALAEYKVNLAKYKAKEISVKPVKPMKRSFPSEPVDEKTTSVKTKNEIDGKDYNYEWIPLEIMHPYASGDTDACRRIHEQLIKNLNDRPKAYDLFTDFYPRFTVALARIESTGASVDQEYMHLINEKYTEEEERLLGLIRELDAVKTFEDGLDALYRLGCEEALKPKDERDEEIYKLKNKYKGKTMFNPNSSGHKGEVLYRILGITLPYNKEMIKDDAMNSGKPESQLTWVDYKTDKHALGYIVEEIDSPEGKELAKLLLQHSKVKTLKNNFTSKLIKLISPKTNKVHGSYNITGTATSRLSSKDPNMQQIPSKTGDISRFDYKYPIKQMFVSRFGDEGCLFQADYSALEMRVLGLVAEDEAMTKAYFDGVDTHKATASIVFSTTPEEVSPDQRQQAKSVSFGLVYGETPASIAPKLNISVKEAEDIFEKYYQSKPKIKDFIERTHQEALKNGYVETMQGHRRLIREAFSDDKSKVNGALRQSVNTIIQGTGAYFTNLSLVYLTEYIEAKNMKSRVIMTVHDSIVIDAHLSERDEIAYVCKYIMENLPIDFTMINWEGKQVRYPIVADIEIGTSYGALVDYDKEELDQYASLKGCVKYHKDLTKLYDLNKGGKLTDEEYEASVAEVEANINYYKTLV